VSRSFAAFRARRRKDTGWIESRIESAFKARNENATAEANKWIDRVGGLTGVPTETLREIADLFANNDGLTTVTAIERLFAWLKAKPARLTEVLRPENVAELFGGEYEKLGSDEARAKYALPTIEILLKIWMAGAPLMDMEAVHPKPDKDACRHARHFALRLVPDLAFLAGLPARLMAAKAVGHAEPLSTVVATLGTAVREGCDRPESLAVRIDVGRNVSRPSARRRFEELTAYIAAGSAHEAFEETLQRVRTAAGLKFLTE
jgi:hypothetical protein